MRTLKNLLLLLLTTTIHLNAQTQIDFEPFGLGDNEESYITNTVEFSLDEIPTFLVIECETPSVNLFNEYQSLINNRLIKGNIQVDYSGSYFSYWDSEAKNHMIVNAQYRDENDEWQSTGKLVFYVPNSYLSKGKNTLTFLNEDNDQRYMDDYYVQKITLHKIVKSPTDRYKDYRCSEK